MSPGLATSRRPHCQHNPAGGHRPARCDSNKTIRSAFTSVACSDTAQRRLTIFLCALCALCGQTRCSVSQKIQPQRARRVQRFRWRIISWATRGFPRKARNWRTTPLVPPCHARHSGRRDAEQIAEVVPSRVIRGGCWNVGFDQRERINPGSGSNPDHLFQSSADRTCGDHSQKNRRHDKVAGKGRHQTNLRLCEVRTIVERVNPNDIA